MIPLRDQDPFEEFVRSILLLPKESPDPEPAVWEQNEIRFLSGEERERARERWAKEDFRADIARLAAKALRPCGHRGWISRVCREAARPWKDHTTQKALRKTPYLLFLASGEEDETPWAVEGQLLFEGGSLPMVLLAAGGLASHVRKEGAGKDYLFCRENDLVFRDDWIVFPGDSVDRGEASRALALWYKERWKSDRHHPVQRGVYPEVRVLF